MFGCMPPAGDPNAFAQMYAQSKGISLPEAQQQLMTTFGNPMPPINFMQTGYNQFNQVSMQPFNFMQTGFNQFYHTQAPETTSGVVQSGLGSSSGKQQLETLGIPADIIAKGDDAIRKYAQEHNIPLPDKKGKKTKAQKPTTPPAADKKPETTQDQKTTPDVSSSQIPQEQQQKLIELGIPKEVIEQGDTAIQKYAQEHNIKNLPDKKKK